MLTKKKMNEVLEQITIMFPDAHCELYHRNSLELVIAVVLSAQCTDALVNQVTPKLFQKYPQLDSYLGASLAEIEEDIRKIGLFRNKAKFIKQLTDMIANDFQGEVPRTREELMKLPGVGRKTANVVISVAFGEPALAVDTHVERVSKRLGFCKKDSSVLEVEQTLMKRIPRESWSDTHHRLIFFGRYHCKAQNPKCGECPIITDCQEGKTRLRQKMKNHH